jgi:hypothetical protein
MVEFRSGIRGMALNLETDNVGVVIFGNDRYSDPYPEKSKKEIPSPELVLSLMSPLEKKCWVEYSMPWEILLMVMAPSKLMREKELKSKPLVLFPENL